MKNFLTSLIFCLGCYLVNAQQTHFIYLQTENKQPFFVKFNNKTLNSYPLGYLIIPNLESGLYSMIIGFPGMNSEHEFNLSVKNKDFGFIIKNTGGQSQLLNVQTLTPIVPGDVVTKPVINYEKETDAFSRMLAHAVHDSTILRKEITQQSTIEKYEVPVVKDTSQFAVSQVLVSAINDTSLTVVTKSEEISIIDSAKSNIAQEMMSEKIVEPVSMDTAVTINVNAINNPTAEIVRSDSVTSNEVTALSSEKSGQLIVQDTMQLVASNENDINFKKVHSDTTAKPLQDFVVTPNETAPVIPEKVIENNTTAQAINSANEVAFFRSVIKRKLKKTNKDGMEMVYVDENAESNDTIRILIPSDKKQKKDDEINSAPIEAVPVADASININKADTKKNTKDKISDEEKEIIKEAFKEPIFITTMINSDCKSVATENDFLRMRKKMVAEKNNEEMIKAARKIFKSKCFTTEQIKNLSVLFLQDQWKYMFFDAAYPFTSDSDKYFTLEKQLSDNYYITRFRAMINK